MIQRVTIFFCALAWLAACEAEKPKQETPTTASAAAPPAPAPTPPPPAPSAEEAKPIEAPKWVDDYAQALCKRVATCREKMLAAAPPEGRTMLAMQMPTQDACLKNTLTFKDTAPKATLDAKEQKALDQCIESVPRTACGNVQTGKVPECQPIVDLLAPKKTE